MIKTIALSQEISKMIELYNEQRIEAEHLDYWEVIDEMVDPTDEQEAKEVIVEILRNI